MGGGGRGTCLVLVVQSAAGSQRLGSEGHTCRHTGSECGPHRQIDRHDWCKPRSRPDAHVHVCMQGQPASPSCTCMRARCAAVNERMPCSSQRCLGRKAPNLSLARPIDVPQSGWGVARASLAALQPRPSCGMASSHGAAADAVPRAGMPSADAGAGAGPGACTGSCRPGQRARAVVREESNWCDAAWCAHCMMQLAAQPSAISIRQVSAIREVHMLLLQSA